MKQKAMVKIIAFSCFLCTLVLKYDILRLWNLLERNFTTFYLVVSCLQTKGQQETIIENRVGIYSKKNKK